MIEMKKVCIICPKGCELTIKEIDSQAKQIEVTGNGCKRGEKFAYEELYNPKRTVQTTVKTIFKGFNRISVKTSDSIPKNAIFDVMTAAKGTVVNKIVSVGDVIVENIADTGVDLIATTNMTIYDVNIDQIL
jgi:CxxC motif-containing protein